ncbi:MAG: FtsX-like permease family protein [Spirochaetaceae bacterium]|jgi:ABC-type lipoprotein release transport system permease subunit|nr:FtsX-like permease family protein [Spirochaetaceae bacterium]
MRIKDAWVLAAKHIVSRRRRYLFLFCALTLGFCVISVTGSLKDGMAESVYNSARDHYSGDIIISGFESETDSGNRIYGKTVPVIQQKIEESGIRPDRQALRTLQFKDSMIHYNGNAAPMRYLTGVDWDAEKEYFDSLNFTEGVPPSGFDDEAILVSAPVAAHMGIRSGDLVMLETETMYGQKNTAYFTVSGVIDDRSLFGYYKSFISRRALNGLISFDPDDCSTIGLYFKDRAGLERKRELLQDALTGAVPLRPLVYDREGFDREKDWEWDGVMFFLLTVSVYVSDVAQILQALNIIAYFLYVMTLLIIMVSAGVTYRLILHERMKEIGTMRAIGCYGSDIRRMMLFEAAILATASLVTGFCVTLFINSMVSELSFSWFPGFEIFLRNGRLLARYSPAATAINAAALYVTLFISVGAPSFRFSREPLPELLSGVY